MKSTKVLNPRLTMPVHYAQIRTLMIMSLVDTIKSIKTGTSVQYPLSIIELWQKYSSTLHACSVTTHSLLLQV